MHTTDILSAWFCIQCT